MSPALVCAYVLYLAGLIAFAVFYAKEEGIRVSTALMSWVAVLLGLAAGLVWPGMVGPCMVAATFYVADKKNRTRIWAIPALFLGPIILLVVVFLPKLQDTSTLGLS